MRQGLPGQRPLPAVSRYPNASNWFICFRIPFQPSVNLYNWGLLIEDRSFTRTADLFLFSSSERNGTINIHEECRTTLSIPEDESLMTHIASVAPQARGVSVFLVMVKRFNPELGPLLKRHLDAALDAVLPIFKTCEVEPILAGPVSPAIMDAETFDPSDIRFCRGYVFGDDVISRVTEDSSGWTVRTKMGTAREWLCNCDVPLLYWEPSNAQGINDAEDTKEARGSNDGQETSDA